MICHIEMGKNGRVIRDRQGNSVNSGTMHWFQNQCKSANSEGKVEGWERGSLLVDFSAEHRRRVQRKAQLGQVGKWVWNQQWMRGETMSVG